MLIDKRYLQTKSSGQDMVVEASHVKVPVPMLFESEMSLASILKKVVLEFAYSLNCVEHLDELEDGDGEQKLILL